MAIKTRLKPLTRLKTPSEHPATGVILVALGALGFSSTIFFARSVVGMDAFMLACFRAWASFLFFCVMLPRHPHTLRPRAYRREWGWLLLMGVTVGATGMLYIYAVQHTTAANAVLLNNTSTLYVALLAPLLLREPRPRYATVSLVLAMVGIVGITNSGNAAPRVGNLSGGLAALLGGVTLAMTILISRHLRGRVGGLTQIWWSTGIAALMALPWGLGVTREQLAVNYAPLIASGVLGHGVPYLLYFLGLQRAPAQVVGIVALLEPVSGVLMGILLYHEVPTLVSLLGIVLILTSIVLVSQKRSPVLPVKGVY